MSRLPKQTGFFLQKVFEKQSKSFTPGDVIFIKLFVVHPYKTTTHGSIL